MIVLVCCCETESKVAGTDLCSFVVKHDSVHTACFLADHADSACNEMADVFALLALGFI
jgi:hypothetical protein